MQIMAQITEYFVIKDLHFLASQRINGLEQFQEIALKYKKQVYPQSSKNASEVCWTKDIGGLKKAKETIVEMFGVTQKYGIFF